MDLHEGFRDPQHAEAAELTRFREEADRLPGIKAIQAALRDAIEPAPGHAHPRRRLWHADLTALDPSGTPGSDPGTHDASP
jgi:hypothetical protein